MKKGTLLVALLILAGLYCSHAQSTPTAQLPEVPQWQIDADGKMAFEVASVKVNKSGDRRRYANIPFNDGPTFVPTGGLLSVTNYPLISYITFAYKITNQQFLFQMYGLPDWASINGEKFDVEARAQGNPTKDQMRLMVQALLADRFKLAMHHEMRQGPVLALGLTRPGKTGPQLQPHSADEPCPNAPTPGHGLPRDKAAVAPSAPSSKTGLQLEPIPCGMVIAGLASSAPGRVRIGGRNLSIGLIGASLGGDDAINRPVIDRTGLTGNFDFTLEWSQQVTFSGPPPPDFHPDPDGPSLLAALDKQLGLTLKSETGPIDVIVIDHVERPSPN